MKKSVLILICGFIILAGIFNSCTKDEEDDFSGPSGTFVDTRDNTEYEWVRIGDQIWMAENLAYLPSVSPSSDDSNTDPYYYVYDYQGSSVSEAKATDKFNNYGVMYNWTAALVSCPNGWRLPTDEDWKVLSGAVSSLFGIGDPVWDQHATVGDVSPILKASTGWNDNGNGTDLFGFSALPGGWRNWDGSCYGIGNFGYWWTSDEYDSERAWDRGLQYNAYGIVRGIGPKIYGFSVRCVRD